MSQDPTRRCCGNCEHYNDPDEPMAGCKQPEWLSHLDTLDNVGEEWVACGEFKWRMHSDATSGGLMVGVDHHTIKPQRYPHRRAPVKRGGESVRALRESQERSRRNHRPTKDEILNDIDLFRAEQGLPPIRRGIQTCTCGNQFYSEDMEHERICEECRGFESMVYVTSERK